MKLVFLLLKEIERVGLDVEDLNITIAELENHYSSLLNRVTLIENGVAAPTTATNDTITHINIQEMYNDLHNLVS